MKNYKAIGAMLLASAVNLTAGHYEDGMLHAFKKQYDQAIVDFTADFKATGKVDSLEHRANCYMLNGNALMVAKNESAARAQYVLAFKDFTDLVEKMKVKEDRPMLKMARSKMNSIPKSVMVASD